MITREEARGSCWTVGCVGQTGVEKLDISDS